MGGTAAKSRSKLLRDVYFRENGKFTKRVILRHNVVDNI